MPKFIIKSQEFDITMDDIEENLRNIEPQKRPRNMYMVKINGKFFPIKQPIIAATGLSLMEVTMLDAYLIMEKLGYRIQFYR